jgi:CHAT domain-containing protein/tetratricopeptide (TPR) repeat protein
MNMRATYGLLVIASILLLISSCATKMSLEEAKKVTIATTEKSFVPPPRKANDINDLLKKKGVFESTATASLIKTADMQSPAGADEATLKGFYEERGLAAYQLGRYPQALGDLRKAYIYLQKTEGNRNVLALNLSILESEIGNLKTAINILEEEIQKNPWPWGFYSYASQVYIRMGDIESARTMNQRCRNACSVYRQTFPRAIDAISRCEAQLNRSDGFLFEAEGRLDKAEDEFRKFSAHWGSHMDTEPRHAILTRQHLIHNLMQQGRLLEAEIETRNALDQSLDIIGKNSAVTGRILTLYVNILRMQGRLQEAERLSVEAIKIFEASGVTSDSWYMSNVRALQGNIFFVQDDYTNAMRVFDRIKADMRENRYLYDKFFTRNLNIMVSMIKTGRTSEALTFVSPVIELNQKMYGDGSYEAAEALGIRAMANAALGNPKEAYHDFSLALPTLMKRSLGQLRNPDRRKRVAIAYESFIDFMSKIRGTSLEKQFTINAVAESYKMMTALTSYSLSGAVGESTARAAAAYDPDLAELVRREQDTQKGISLLQETISDLLAAPADEVTAKGIKESRARLDTLTRARNAILDEIEKRFPKYAEYVNPQLSTIELTQQNLREGEALLSIYTADDTTYIWSVPKGSEAIFTASPLGKKELTDIVAKLRKSLDAHPSVLGDIPEYDLSLAYDLYRRIFKPMENSLKDASDILAVVRGPLGQLPLAILPTAPVPRSSDGTLLFSKYRKVPWLIRKASVTMLPSVSSFITLRSLPAGDPTRKAFAGFGDPIFSKDQVAAPAPEKSRKTTHLASRGARVQIRGVRVTGKGDIDNKQINSLQLANLNRLPDTASEIIDIAKALNADVGKDTFLGEHASEHTVKTADLSNRRVIAFATHALVPGDLDGLDQPTLALSSPSVTGDTEDGLLTMGEIMKLRLNADWVVLSACNTGASEGSGSEALSGLGRAFFYAGTRTLLASMWPVETTSAKKLVSDIFRKQQSDGSLTRARALRKSMIGLIDDAILTDQESGKTIASYAHPLFWAPFVMAGDPGK